MTRAGKRSSGGASDHVPVLCTEVVDLLGGATESPLEGWILDATVGAGGHARALLETHGGVRILGTDWDPVALERAAEVLAPFGDRVRLSKSRASQLDGALAEAGIERPAGMLLDLGVSSMQIDAPERGFSFLADGPLDMRMDPSRARTAADIVNGWDESDLADLFFYEGDERDARKVARAIVEGRRRVPFARTAPLADLVANTLRSRSPGKIHAATRVFQSLRRAVNEEGEELLAALAFAEERLADGAVLAVISFHSGEDRAVKHFLRAGVQEGRWELQTRKPVRPARSEVRANRRARSAVLRAALRTRGRGA